MNSRYFPDVEEQSRLMQIQDSLTSYHLQLEQEHRNVERWRFVQVKKQAHLSVRKTWVLIKKTELE